MFSLNCPYCEEQQPEDVIVDGWIFQHTIERLFYEIRCVECESVFALRYDLREVIK